MVAPSFLPQCTGFSVFRRFAVSSATKVHNPSQIGCAVDARPSRPKGRTMTSGVGARVKRNLLWLVFALSTAAHGVTPDGGTHPPQLRPSPQEAQAAHLAAELLTRRSEERRVGKEWRSGWSRTHEE